MGPNESTCYRICLWPHSPGSLQTVPRHRCGVKQSSWNCDHNRDCQGWKCSQLQRAAYWSSRWSEAHTWLKSLDSTWQPGEPCWV